MTILDKLHIKGIRSYNPKKFQSIEFQNPLTLIVGQNGTGKTTIIESLKYATTNILPPNTKGGAFIYDNNLANDAEVKAEIKLSILEKNKTENKTIELNIFVNDNKLEKSLNKSDLNKIFDLNISILNNVIFCHQDESMWCLSEPSVNKKYLMIFFHILSKLKITQTELENLHLECKKMSIIKNKKDEISKIKILKEIKFTENECNELLEKQDLNYLKKEITTNKKIKCWINEQQINFQNKLKLKDINMNNLNYKEVFDNFFSKYEIELRKKNNILENLRKNFEKLKNEFDENSKIITKYENIFLTNPEILYSDDIKLSMNDINNKIVDLEKKYDVCMKFNKDFILNEEKKNRKNDILKKLKI
ncbi:dna repair protein rad50 [Vairimorpha apis BRL 01]|uniref:Dna repair protein rad50 n=1 Tax=Vairimorpha apis BRL 01 TaxID=1037528 RepID=T0M9R8_9MICR|nr:dna repair protein rad50 [Vairimorpha apis BRL 01]